MRRSTKIVAASAAILTVSGFGANAALALDEDTACSDIAGFTVCVLAESSSSYTVIASAERNDGSISAALVEYRSEGSGGLVMLAGADGLLAAEGGQGYWEGGHITGAVVEAYDSDGDATGADALIYNDAEDDDDSWAVVEAGQSDSEGSTFSGLHMTNDDCDVVLGNQHLADCIVDPNVVEVPRTFYVNLP